MRAGAGEPISRRVPNRVPKPAPRTHQRARASRPIDGRARGWSDLHVVARSAPGRSDLERRVARSCRRGARARAARARRTPRHAGARRAAAAARRRPWSSSSPRARPGASPRARRTGWPAARPRCTCGAACAASCWEAPADLARPGVTTRAAAASRTSSFARCRLYAAAANVREEIGVGVRRKVGAPEPVDVGDELLEQIRAHLHLADTRVGLRVGMRKCAPLAANLCSDTCRWLVEKCDQELGAGCWGQRYSSGGDEWQACVGSGVDLRAVWCVLRDVVGSRR